ncbi:MAG: PTS sugar transporter subunit IIA, partial [Lacticaseibacillus paracasei]|nr:PTS sugar transporter subunit IIA [Lacticaseibacillus paracasei]
ATLTDSSGLDHALRRFLANQAVEEFPAVDQPRLTTFTEPDLIQIGRSRNWEQALQQAIQPLERLDYVTDPFRKTLMAETAASDNYSFIGTQVAIPHTVPGNGVLRNGFGFYILKQPVVYPNGFRIRLIVPIAVKDTDQHLQAIQELSEIIADEATLKGLLKTKNGQQAYDILKKYESDHLQRRT